MNEAIEAAVLRAIEDRDVGGPALSLSYSRGHGLSGITRLELGGDGYFTITSDDTAERRSATYTGTLDEAQRASILRSIVDTGVLGVQSSTRNLGDDEIPALLTIRAGDAVLDLRVWDGDAKHDRAFHAFESALLTLIRALSNDEVRTSVD